jgi:alpha-galactosidase
VTKDRNYIYQAAMLDPHTASELSIDEIKAMVDELIEAHGEYMAGY